MDGIQLVPKEDKTVMPFMIIQFKGKACQETLEGLSKTVKNAFCNGCLVCDEQIRIIAFDNEGKLSYSSPD